MRGTGGQFVMLVIMNALLPEALESWPLPLFERLPRLRLARSPEYKDVYHFHGLDTLEVTW